jgi:hypothetical protein
MSTSSSEPTFPRREDPRDQTDHAEGADRQTVQREKTEHARRRQNMQREKRGRRQTMQREKRGTRQTMQRDKRGTR